MGTHRTVIAKYILASGHKGTVLEGTRPRPVIGVAGAFGWGALGALLGALVGLALLSRRRPRQL